VLNADEYTIYQGIAKEMEGVKEHWVVNHSQGEWARGEAHVNGCENPKWLSANFLEEASGYFKDVFTLFEPFTR